MRQGQRKSKKQSNEKSKTCDENIPKKKVMGNTRIPKDRKILLKKRLTASKQLAKTNDPRKQSRLTEKK